MRQDFISSETIIASQGCLVANLLREVRKLAETNWFIDFSSPNASPVRTAQIPVPILRLSGYPNTMIRPIA